MAIPILGYFILFNDHLQEYLKLHTSYCPVGGCSVSWRIFLIYFGCCSIAIGAALYSWKCPALIKKYDFAAAFFEAEKVYFSEPRNLDYLLSLVAAKRESQILSADAAAFSYEGRQRIDPDALAAPMGELYREQMYTHPITRAAALFSYTVGTILLAIPTIGTFIQVVQKFWQSNG